MKTIVVGLGNPLRGDDAAGPLAVEALDLNIRTIILEQPLDLVDVLQGFDTTYIVDASLCDLPAGEVVQLEWPTERLGDYRSPSTHTMSLPQSLKLAETLGDLPAVVRIFAISGKEFRTGQPACEEVKSAAREVARTITEEIRACQSG